MEKSAKRRFHWGWGIAALYGGFALFILVIVWYAAMQRFDLVDKDYYAKGIDYERQIERIRRADALPEKPMVQIEGGELVVRFPSVGRSDDYSGTVTIFRPSAASLDIASPITLDQEFSQRVASDRLVAGLWRVKLAWTVGGIEYYQEREMRLE
jgi:hypothetical protein